MKTLGFKAILGVVALLSGVVAGFGQASQPEVPGDNFSLEGALELFKKSSSPEEFEKMLNTPDTKVNNLDLNGDGYIDYVRVNDIHQGNIHTFVIQAIVAEDEFQDIAVIALEKKANGKAILQITGNEDIYGVTTIIEPTREVRTYAGAYASNTVVNVWAWPVVQYVYGPHYRVWVSPWRWHYRPVWWSPWRPIAYYDYYPIWRPYYSYYAVCHTPRVYVHHIYYPHRRTSTIVHHRYNTQVVHYRNNYNRNGRTRDDRRYIDSNVSSNGRQRVDANNASQFNRQSIERTNAARRGSALTAPSRTTTRSSAELSERSAPTLRDNGNTREQTLTRPSSTQRDLPEGNRQRAAGESLERGSSGTVQESSVLPSRDNAARMKVQENRIQRQPAAPTQSGSRSSGQIQRSNNNVQRPTSVERERAPAQMRQAPAQTQRAPAQIQRSAPANKSQRQQVSPSRERGGSSGRSAIQRQSNGNNSSSGQRGRR